MDNSESTTKRGKYDNSQPVPQQTAVPPQPLQPAVPPQVQQLLQRIVMYRGQYPVHPQVQGTNNGSIPMAYPRLPIHQYSALPQSVPQPLPHPTPVMPTTSIQQASKNNNPMSDLLPQLYVLTEKIFNKKMLWRIGHQKWDEDIVFVSPDIIIQNANVIQHTDIDKCEICLENATAENTLVKMMECSGSHYFHKSCIKRWLNVKMECPYCKIAFPGVVPGPQPDSGTMVIGITKNNIPGEVSSGSIAILFMFQDGIQDSRHQSPGQKFTGTYRTVYLPNTIESKNAVKRIKYAWDVRILFNIGTSLTTGQPNCIIWNGIPFKTRLDGGPALHGYPDPGYLAELNAALDAHNVPTF